jgi:hypothetical protein
LIPRHARLLMALGICGVSFRTIAEPPPLVVIDAHNDTVQTLTELPALLPTLNFEENGY